MRNELLACKDWAEREFLEVKLGDLRRTKRLIRVAAALAANPKGTLPPAISMWSELKGAYRLLDMEEVSFEKIASPHWRRTIQACSAEKCFLLIEDTTLLDFSSQKSKKGMGRIGDDRGRGMLLHTSLALKVHRWKPFEPVQTSLLGIAHQQPWVRPDELVRGQVKRGFEKKKRRFTRKRESERWGAALEKFGPLTQGCQGIYIADRESDIYETFDRCAEANFDYVIRANQSRALLNSEDHIEEALAQQVQLGRYEIALRARPKQPARVAQVAVRATRVTLRPPYRPGDTKPRPRELTVVEAREIGAPAGVEPLHWILLSSLPVVTFSDARKVIELYTTRWIIEEYHKALKTGVGMEKTQLEEERRVESLLGVLSLVAVRLLNTKLLAKLDKKALSLEIVGPEILEILNCKFGTPPGGWTPDRVLIAIARMGGFLARKSDGDPGWITIWRGWQKLMIMAEGAELASNKCG